MSNHNHEHSHTHDVSDIKGINLIITILLNLAITVAEVIGGLYSGSLSLLSDALHNLSDMLSIVVSYFAIKISQKSNAYILSAIVSKDEIKKIYKNAERL